MTIGRRIFKEFMEGSTVSSLAAWYYGSRKYWARRKVENFIRKYGKSI